MSMEILSLTITRELVQLFAQVTGDSSSLHTDAAYARNSSMYRENVAHGMLPISALLLTKKLAATLSEPTIEQISGRFVRPIFIGEKLHLVVEQDAGDSSRIACSFLIRRANSETIVTSGRVVYAAGVKPIAGLSCSQEVTGLLRETIVEKNQSFEDIRRGEASSLKFQVTEGGRKQFIALARQLTGQFDKDILPPDPLMIVSLLSTFVGMKIPGRKATFLEFDLAFSGKITPDVECQLLGKVAFLSDSTRAVSIHTQVEGLASGRVLAKVEKESIKMPSISELSKGDPGGIDVFGIRDKVAIVTGSSRGIGATIAKTLALNGARVVINYHRSRSSAEQVVNEIVSAGGQALAIQCDVTQPSQVSELLENVKKQWGSVEILVNSAISPFYPAPFLEQNWEKIADLHNVVVRGAFNLSAACLPDMRAKKWGRIVNIGTIFTENPILNQTSYIMAKCALAGLTKALALEFASHNILVNQVIPSVVETDLNSSMSKISLAAEVAKSPQKRLASSIDVANAVLYLVSNLSNYTTGQNIFVTGGQVPLS